MFRKIPLVFMFILCFALILSSSGCAKKTMREKLEGVAKEWCYVVRASQMIPVYPLTEDLMPGDIFLTSTPISDQAEEYKKKGFLPLDFLLVRLYSQHQGTDGADDFQKYYHSGSKGKECRIPPADLGMFNRKTNSDELKGEAEKSVKRSETADVDEKKRGAEEDAKSELMIMRQLFNVSFPTYSISVKSGGGFNLAIPIKSLQFSMGFMKTNSADVSVSICEARTYGLDFVTLYDRVQKWAANNRKSLREYAPRLTRRKDDKEKSSEESIRYLRVVSRVYYTRKLKVSVVNRDFTGVKGNLGTDSSMDLSKSYTKEKGDNYADLLKTLNDMTNRGANGASTQFSLASQRSVEMDETFDRPLVLGYLGFDIPILDDGRLGLPMATTQMLTEPSLEAQLEIAGASQIMLSTLSGLHAFLEVQNEGCVVGAQELLERFDAFAQENIPVSYAFNSYEWDSRKREVKLGMRRMGDPTYTGKATFKDLLHFTSNADITKRLLTEFPDNENKQKKQDKENAARALDAILRAFSDTSLFSEAFGLSFSSSNSKGDMK